MTLKSFGIRIYANVTVALSEDREERSFGTEED